jgi:hypothetical protein
VVLLSIGLREETDESGRHGGRNLIQLIRSSLHHFYRHDLDRATHRGFVWSRVLVLIPPR